MKLWDKIQGDPVFMRKVNGWQTIVWIVAIPLSYALGLLESVAYVSILSITALALSALSSWQASRTEVAQDQSEDGLTEDDREWIVSTFKELLSDKQSNVL